MDGIFALLIKTVNEYVHLLSIFVKLRKRAATIAGRCSTYFYKLAITIKI